MKWILSAVVAIACFPAAAQTCDLLKEKDQFTQQPMVSTRFMELGGGALLFSIDADAKEIRFDFAPGSRGQSDCYDNKTTITFLYEGGRLKNYYRNTGYMNCKGLLQVSFRNISGATPGTIRRLSTNKVIKVIITDGNKKASEIELQPAEQERLLQMAGCLFEEAKNMTP